MTFPWVGWYQSNGWSYIGSWTGKTRCVIVAPTPRDWRPDAGIPDGAKVYEVNPMWSRQQRIHRARELSGVVVIVLDAMPRGADLG